MFFFDAKVYLRVDPFVAAKSTIVGDLFWKNAAQFDQQLGLKHTISVDLALDLKTNNLYCKCSLI
jgi:hypothetical protein